MLELKDIRKTYTMGGNEVHALQSVSLRIDKGDYVAIMGPSGSGKSTLMHILGLLDVPTSGSYKVDGREVSHLSEDELAVFRREVIGFIFQQFNLLPRMSARENVALPLLYSKKIKLMARAAELLQMLGLGTRMDHRPNELSGGQQQRVAIARSLINQPAMILADEPTGNLDSISEKDILASLKSLNDQGITVVIVTHEEEVGLQAKRLIRMRDGLIQSDERLTPLADAKQVQGQAEPFHEAPASFRLIDFVEYFRQGFKTLAANKVRTFLSMLGILIGVGAVVAMLALGSGARKAIEDQLAALGSNLLVLRSGALRVGGVSQGMGSSNRLTLDDLKNLKQMITSAREICPQANGRGQVTRLNKNWSTQVLGAGASYAKMHVAEPAMGRFFTEYENQKRLRVAVIGMTIVREVFGGENPIGEMIKINKVNFQVIGILPEKGANSFRDQDDIIIIPTMTALHRLFGRETLDAIEFEIADPLKLDSSQDQILEIMKTRHPLPPSIQDNAFEVRNMADIQAAMAESSRTMSVLLTTIAAISLLVGGIGIMNIMLVSVTERTREIGLRKAIGARRWDILAQFLSESVVVSLVGGLAGIVLGWLATEVLSAAVGWNTSITLNSVLVSFLFSASIGVIFGFYPARKASALHPIEALRHD
jgi:macrolide transport system ATP-binding/permease protein